MSKQIKESQEIEIKRHSLSHVLAVAVQKMFPDAKLGIGPAIDNGFYYDFELPRSLIPEDLKTITSNMKKLIAGNAKFERYEMPADEAFKKLENEPYKQELINDLKNKGETNVSFYKTGDFEDLCAGPHVASTKDLPPFKLTSIAGAYWKGSEENIMMQRVYGLAFSTQSELDDYIKMQEEAKKRDHRKLGKELDLFVFSDLIGPGLPLFTPKGTVILDELQKHIENLCRKHGFQKVSTPHLAKLELYEISGHKQKFGDELFHVKSHFKQDYVLKPVQCPHQIQIYASRPRSYRDLPIRYMESNKQYRDEKPGEISGLKRVIAITVEDGHTFCTKAQVKTEIITLVKLIQDFYDSLGLLKTLKVTLSVRDYSSPEKYIGEPADWYECEKILQEVSDKMRLEAKRCEGEAALYGPKLDFMFKDALGNEIQIPTVQIDFATPKRFNLTYTDKHGKDAIPVMVHRAILGSYERFLVLLIEHFAGALPTWLSPIQVKILPIADRHNDYAEKIKATLGDIRTEVDDRTESIGKKIREAEMQKIPYMLIVGDKEVEENKVAVRRYGKGDLGSKSVEEFAKEILEEIQERSA